MPLNAGESVVRCRMAPSPTGPLHFGTARTALVNWLFARHNRGIFVLRMEDTDKARSTKESEEEILSGLKWLGIEWDEGPDIGGPYAPYRQSERGDTYEPHIRRLLDENKAYYCYCTKDELEKEKQEQLARGVAPKYNGRCSAMPPLDREPQVIRFRMPERTVSFHDLIHGNISFDLGLIGDIVIARNTREPLYNFAAVIDDFEMKITHVIRGDDHIANTPKQISFGEALGFPIPQFAHVPIILNPDRSKMSKRFTETSLVSYRAAGYLPGALMNFIALLGWHPKDDQEIFSKQELIKKFELERMQKAGAVFDEQKLKWMNEQYIRNTDVIDLMSATKYTSAYCEMKPGDETLKIMLDLGRNRFHTLNDIKEYSFREYSPSLLLWKDASPDETSKILFTLKSIVASLPEFKNNINEFEQQIRSFAEKEGRGRVLSPLRVALSGRDKSPTPFEIAQIEGKDETLRRLQIAIHKL